MPLEDRSTEVEPDAHIKASSSNEDDPENEEIAGGQYTIGLQLTFGVLNFDTFWFRQNKYKGSTVTCDKKYIYIYKMIKNYVDLSSNQQ